MGKIQEFYTDQISVHFGSVSRFVLFRANLTHFAARSDRLVPRDQVFPRSASICCQCLMYFISTVTPRLATRTSAARLTIIKTYLLKKIIKNNFKLFLLLSLIVLAYNIFVRRAKMFGKDSFKKYNI